MRDGSPLQAILSLFTTPDRAEAITGDLTEERAIHGSAWFWFHGSRTMLALFTGAAATAPLTVLALAALGLALLVMLSLAGVAAVFLFPSIAPSASRVLLTLFWWSTALWTGVSLVKVSPRDGMAACLTLAIACEALLLLWLFLTEPSSILLYASALFTAAPLLAGGAIARRKSARIADV